MLASKFFKFSREGDLIYKIRLKDLKNVEQIYISSLEKMLLFEENLIKEDTVTAEYISEKLNLEIQQVRSRLSDLVKEDKLKRVERGEYRVNIYCAPDYLKTILEEI